MTYNRNAGCAHVLKIETPAVYMALNRTSSHAHDLDNIHSSRQLYEKYDRNMSCVCASADARRRLFRATTLTLELV